MEFVHKIAREDAAAPKLASVGVLDETFPPLLLGGSPGRDGGRGRGGGDGDDDDD